MKIKQFQNKKRHIRAQRSNNETGGKIRFSMLLKNLILHYCNKQSSKEETCSNRF